MQDRPEQVPTLARPRLGENRTALLAAALVAVGPLSMSLYTPAMPALAAALGTTAANVKLTLTSYFAGFCVAQLVCGPLSDAYGRRPVALGFFALYLAASLAAALAPTIEALIAARLAQGIGAAAGVVLSRALIRDLFTGQAAARILSTTGIIMGVAPALAPSLGAFVFMLAGWRATFFTMVGFGLAIVAMLATVVPETNVAPDRSLARPGPLLRAYGTVLRDGLFLRTALLVALPLGGLYAFAAALPFIIIDRIGLSPTAFGFVSLIQSAGFLGGGLVTRRMLGRTDARHLAAAGVAVLVASGIALAVVPRALGVSVPTIMGPVAIWTFALALILPWASSAALHNHGRLAGAASAMLGFLQMGAGALATAAAVFFVDATAAVTTLQPLLALVTGLVFLAGLRGRPASA